MNRFQENHDPQGLKPRVYTARSGTAEPCPSPETTQKGSRIPGLASSPQLQFQPEAVPLADELSPSAPAPGFPFLRSQLLEPRTPVRRELAESSSISVRARVAPHRCESWQS